VLFEKLTVAELVKKILLLRNYLFYHRAQNLPIGPTEYILRLFFFNSGFEAISTAATPGLLCQPRVIVKMIVEKQMECTLAWETEVLGENLPQSHFDHHKSHMTRPGFEPGPQRWEAGD
jgi:hypothetical protein